MAAKVVLVTGCSAGGIGFSLCEEFAARQCIVYATARNTDKMKGLTQPNIHPLSMDVNSDEDVRRVVETIISEQGKIDIVVNNAGVACHGPTLEISSEDVREAFETNVFAILRTCKTVLPHMAARKQGLFVNIGSVVGNIPTPWAGIYASTKAAVHSITQTLQMECRPFNIDVMLVATGGVKSNIASNYMTKFELRPDSLYKAYLNNILGRIASSQTAGSMSTDVFARGVVNAALARKPRFYLTLGAASWTFKLFEWLPRLLVLNILWRRLSAGVKLR
ncbi:NAD-P-binding protein [Dentipellis sp. KUC8613]|nr:NAD-P-binding protein [Dentipellis sp. KUC8613]